VPSLRLLIALALGLGLCGPISAAEFAPGDPAPDFTLAGSDGRSVSLADFLGKRDLVLAWFPKAFTPG
jgi:peroxiredoxin Q/BCP